MKKLTVLLLLLSFLHSFSQEQQQYKNLSSKVKEGDIPAQTDFGVGLGLNYGGLLGVQVQYVPFEHLTVFGAVGYYMVGLGWQVGGSVYLMPKIPSKPFRVYGTFMYGTNAAIVILDESTYNKIYLGPTFGGGIEMRFGKKKRSGLNIDLFIPIRSDEFKTDWDNLKYDPTITDVQEPLPFTISIGYHFEIN